MDMVLSLISNLNINSSLFIIVGVFVGTYAICYVLFLRKLSTFLVERDSRTQGRSESVDGLNDELHSLSDELKEKKKIVQKEAYLVFSSIKQKASDEQASALKTAKDKAAAELKASREEIEKELADQLEKVKKEIPVLTSEIINKLLTAGKRQPKNGVDSPRKELV